MRKTLATLLAATALLLPTGPAAASPASPVGDRSPVLPQRDSASGEVGAGVQAATLPFNFNYDFKQYWNSREFSTGGSRKVCAVLTGEAKDPVASNPDFAVWLYKKTGWVWSSVGWGKRVPLNTYPTRHCWDNLDPSLTYRFRLDGVRGTIGVRGNGRAHT